MRKFIAGMALVAIGLTSAAFAADLPVKARPMVVAPVSDWTGIYLGLSGGYGWGDSQDWNTSPIGSNSFIGSTKAKGGLFGGEVGYNYQMASWVVGAQVDGAWANIRGKAANPLALDGRCGFSVFSADQTSDCNVNYKAMSNFTAKLGYLVTPSTLIYGKAGINLSQLDLRVNNVIDITGGTCSPIGSMHAPYQTNSDSHSAFTAGAGIEQKFGSNFSVFGEYDYIDLHGSSTDQNIGGDGGCTRSFASNTTLRPISIVKVGVNYTFH